MGNPIFVNVGSPVVVRVTRMRVALFLASTLLGFDFL